MKSAEYEARIARRDQLSAVDVLGSFDFSTTLIHLKSLVTADIERARAVSMEYKPNWNGGNPDLLTGDQYSALTKANPLIIHEYTHFIDATSTLWGLRHLKLMSEAYAARSLCENEYYKSKIFFDHVRSIRLPDYYTVKNGSADEDMPWRYNITIGRLFGSRGEITNRPVLFSRFRNSGGDVIVRSPISTVSILEASAMAQEIISRSYLLKLTNQEYRLIEDREVQRKTLKFLYSRDLTEYSVCVHVLANKLGCKDVLVAFGICARLTRLVLNFPQVIFDKLVETCPIEQVLNIPAGHAFGLAVRDGLRGRDLGTLYYLLCNALPGNVIQSEQNLEAGISVALNALGVQDEVLHGAAEAEANDLAALLNTSPIASIKTLAAAGYDNSKTIGLKCRELRLDKLNLPPAILGDDTALNPFARDGNSLTDFDIESCFSELDDGSSWVARFSEGCV